MLPHNFLDQLADGSLIRDINHVPFQIRLVFSRGALQAIEFLLYTIGNNNSCVSSRNARVTARPKSAGAPATRTIFPSNFALMSIASNYSNLE